MSYIELLGYSLSRIIENHGELKMTEAVLENPDLFDLTMSEQAQPLLDAVKKHIKENVDPITEEYFRLGEGRKEHWGYGEGQLELLETVKKK